jgi:hypothetical protein
MPFQIFNGQSGQRLIIVEPRLHDRATVILIDSRRVTVAPSMTIINGYPGIRATLQGLPQSVVGAFQNEVHMSMRRVKTLRQIVTEPLDIQQVKSFDRMIESLKTQPLLCATIVVGQPLRLVLPPTVFTGRTRFELPPVKALVVERALSTR